MLSFIQTKLVRDIEDAIRKCKKSIFIFDEVDKIPEGVFELLKSLLDHHSHVEGIDFRQAIFIFLSNAGGIEIGKTLAKKMTEGKYREDTKIQDFESVLETAAFNLDGGLKKAGIIKSSLIDHFIPFLPLEKRHVDQCILKEFKQINVEPTDEQFK